LFSSASGPAPQRFLEAEEDDEPVEMVETVEADEA
jgi:hypothetical protein